MVYNIKDIKHLETMNDLEDTQTQEIDVKSLLNLNASGDSSLDGNILTLCSGLRTKGFDKLARSLEDKFVAFKQAEVHLYKVHEEDGEDLIERAHPEGDTNMADGELGDVETIVSRHNKIVDVVRKKPTGKLASYLEQCKVALGQDLTNVQAKLKDSILKSLGSVKRKLKSIDDVVTKQGDLWFVGTGKTYQPMISSCFSLIDSLTSGGADTPNLNIPDIEKLMQMVAGLTPVLKGYSGVTPFGGLDEKIQKLVMPMIDQVKDILPSIKNAIETYVGRTMKQTDALKPLDSVDVPDLPVEQQNEVKPNQAAQLLALIKQIQNAVASSKKLTDAQKQQYNKWIQDTTQEVNAGQDLEARSKEISSVLSSLPKG